MGCFTYPLGVTMTNAQAAQILTEYQAWRRGGDMPMPDPVLIGQAIDLAIKSLREKSMTARRMGIRKWDLLTPEQQAKHLAKMKAGYAKHLRKSSGKTQSKTR